MAGELLAGSPTELRLDLSVVAVPVRQHSPEAGHELVQIAREALSNVARHSGAGDASLSLRVDGDVAVLRVEDDGRGFDPEQRLGVSHFGLANLRDRAAAIAGSLRIDTGVGKGTRIIVRLPITPVEDFS